MILLLLSFKRLVIDACAVLTCAIAYSYRTNIIDMSIRISSYKRVVPAIAIKIPALGIERVLIAAIIG